MEVAKDIKTTGNHRFITQYPRPAQILSCTQTNLCSTTLAEADIIATTVAVNVAARFRPTVVYVDEAAR